MNKVFSMMRESRRRRRGRRGWKALSLAALLMVLFLYPARAYASMPDTAAMPDAAAMQNAPPEGMSADSAPEAPPNTVAFPGMATQNFGPSVITGQSAITLLICVVIWAGGMAFCIFFRRKKKSF